MPEHTHAERLIRIEEIVTRVEKKLDSMERRVGRLEHWGAWLSGGIAVAVLWLKVTFAK